jgi:hypothetical protein
MPSHALFYEFSVGSLIIGWNKVGINSLHLFVDAVYQILFLYCLFVPGLMRDIFTHKITTPEHWSMLMMPTVYTRAELDYDRVVGPDTVVTPSYDPHCITDVSGGCRPVAIISAEKLRDYTEGPQETAAIANVLMNNGKMSQYVIASEAWDCIWDELIAKGKGLKTVVNRPTHGEDAHRFSAEMFGEMITELTRLITKYSSSEWNTLSTSNRLVDLLTEHRELIQSELNELDAGSPQLSVQDFLGPMEREKRRLEYVLNSEDPTIIPKSPKLSYYDAMEREHTALRKQRVVLAQQMRELRNIDAQLRGNA